MKILIDMNLSPQWTRVFTEQGHTASHWSSVGEPCAEDSSIMSWAREHGYVLFTHDLDFGTVLALTRARGPSVIQVRMQDVMPENCAPMVLSAVEQFRAELSSGALISLDGTRGRARILPIHP